MNNPKFLALLTIFIWSFGMYLTKLIALKSQFLLMFLSYVFTFITLLIYSVYEYKNSLLKMIREYGFKGLILGPFGYFIYSIGLIQSCRAFGTVSETTILNYTWPIFTVIFTELFFKKKSQKPLLVHIIEALGVILGFLSVIVLSSKGNFSSLEISSIKGIGWGLLSGISYGLFSAYSSTVSKDKQSIFLLSSIFISLILMLIFSIQEFKIISTITVKDIFIVAILGCLLNGIGYITWTAANRLANEKEISISAIASLMYILPLLSLVIVFII